MLSGFLIMSDIAPRFPLYIPSKGRHQFMVTTKALTAMGVPHNIVVEPQEVADYKRAANGTTATILELDMSFKARYELCDSHGLNKSTGSGPARNYAWEHAKAAGFDFYWIMDDNIRCFYRLHANRKHKLMSGAAFRAMEDFVLRYDNVAMAGPNYEMFVPRKQKHPPFIANTRIYSCNLIRTNLPFRWRGRYNEDTILSLDLLKAGWCTILFNAFLQDKMRTQLLPGGNTTELYAGDGKKNGAYTQTGTIDKSQMLVDVHPDVSRVVWKFGRWHHEVNYRGFKNQKLQRRAGLAVPSEPNEYGMRLAKVR